MNSHFFPFIYALFILAINALSEPRKAYKGNLWAMIAMCLAIFISFYHLPYQYLPFAILSLACGAIIGIITAKRIKISDLPQMVALLNGLGGLSAGIIGIIEISATNHPIWLSIIIIFIGFTTFSGSIAAFLKLNYNKLPLDNKSIRASCFIILITTAVSAIYAYSADLQYVLGFAILCCLLGFFFILPIGGADMAIIISILNSFSGWSTVMVGFSLNNTLMIITGTIIGASGTILSYIMTKAMNRNLLKVLFTPFKEFDKNNQEQIKTYHIGTPRDAAFLMENATKVIIIPGFGMAAAGAQNELANMVRILKNNYNVITKFAIHPVAGRMPGHMNVLLAEANINPDDVFELKDINQEFQTTDVVYIIGANDITNPLAKTEKNSPIYKMPILEVERAKRILFVKRSLGPGYSGIDNPLFYADNTLMLLGDAKEITKKIVTELEENI